MNKKLEKLDEEILILKEKLKKLHEIGVVIDNLNAKIDELKEISD